jgi:flagellar biosynthesis component FlhA
LSIAVFHKQLSEARKEKGMTQKSFASKIGVSEQAVSKWERGLSFPSLDVLESIVTVLGCSYNFMFDYKSAGTIDMDQLSSNKRNEVAACQVKDILTIEFGVGLVELFVKEMKNGFDIIHKMRKELADEWGILLPLIRIRDNIECKENEYCFKIHGRTIATGCAYNNKNIEFEPHILEEGEYTFIDPVLGKNAVWTNRQGPYQVDATNYILFHFKDVVIKNYNQILNKQLVYEMLKAVERESLMTVQNVVPEKISYNFLKRILLELIVIRGKPVNNLIMIIEKIEEEIDRQVFDTREIVEEIIVSGI